MKILERLEGTSLEEEPIARLVCSILDWCDSIGVNTPTVREWSMLLSCFNKKDTKKPLSIRQVRKIFDKLVDESVISLTSGSGRNRNAIDIPDGSNLVADKKAAYKERKRKWEEEVKDKLRKFVDNGEATWKSVETFIDYWSEYDKDYNMRCEVVTKNGKSNSFSVLARWNNWKDKKKKPDVENDVGTNWAEEIQKDLQAKKKAEEDRRNSVPLDEVLRMKEEWLREQGATEWNDELRKQYFEYCIKNKK